MAKLPVVSSKPKVAVQYIVHPEKLKGAAGPGDLFRRTRRAIRGMGFALEEFGPLIDADEIAANALACGDSAAMLGVTFAGTSARQTAALGRFSGPVGVWYFPGSPWWSMASAGSGIGYLRDEARARDDLKVTALWGDPDDDKALERVRCFAAAAHTVYAMKREKIGLIGGSYYDVMPASNWHPDALTNRLGPSYVEADMSLLERECASVTNAEALTLVRRLTGSGMKVADDATSLETIKASARVSVAVEHLQKKLNLTGVALNCYGGADPEGYTGVLGRCGASGCLKAHALSSVVMGCESDVIQCAQQMMFRHLVGKIPCMADPWTVDQKTGELIAGTCSGPAELSGEPGDVTIEAGTLMSLYKVGVLGVCFPKIEGARAIVARLHGRDLDRMVVATGNLVGSDSTTIPGRLAIKVKLDNPGAFLERGVIGNHYTFLPTGEDMVEMARLEMLCDFMDIDMERC
jgi:hypothetical protein